MKLAAAVRALAVCLAVILFGSSLTACIGSAVDAQPSSFDTVVLVVGAHANSPALTNDMWSSEAREDLEATIKENKLKEVTVYNATSTPSATTISLDMDFNEPDQTIQNSRFKQAIGALYSKVAEIKPLANGADYIEAVREAAKSAKGKRPLIIVLGSGLSDSGYLDFAHNDYLGNEPSTVTNTFPQSDVLAGYAVHWYRLGETVAPQIPLPSDIKEREAAMYDAAFRRLGVREFRYSTEMMATKTKQVNDAHPYLVKQTGYESPTPLIIDSLSPIEFPEAVLPFIPNTADFANEQQAEEALGGVIQLLKENKQVRITVEGHEASLDGSKKSEGVYSAARAERVRSLLIAAGIEGSRVTAVDRGTLESTGVLQSGDRKVVFVWSE